MDEMTFKRWMKVWNYLEDNLSVKVDLVPEKDLRVELRRYVLPEVRYVEEL
jgi:predicted nucleotidyltransferase